MKNNYETGLSGLSAMSEALKNFLVRNSQQKYLLSDQKNLHQTKKTGEKGISKVPKL